MGQEYESCRVDRQRRADAYRVQLAESRTDSGSRIYAASNQETCGEPVPGVDYIFRSRRNDIEMIRRFSHVTPTGLWSVEVFKGPDGRPGGQCLEPSSWRPGLPYLAAPQRLTFPPGPNSAPIKSRGFSLAARTDDQSDCPCNKHDMKRCET
jgi:hypothetical protein